VTREKGGPKIPLKPKTLSWSAKRKTTINLPFPKKERKNTTRGMKVFLQSKLHQEGGKKIRAVKKKNV